MALVEDERGPISELFHRLSSEPGFSDTAAVLACCTDGQISDDDVLDSGLNALASVALELVGTAFDERAQKQAQKDKPADRDESDDGRLPVARMTGTAIVHWNVPPDSAWQMTVPEWWDAAAVQVEANTPKDASAGWAGLTEEERDEVRRQDAEMPAVWPTQPEEPEE